MARRSGTVDTELYGESGHKKPHRVRVGLVVAIYLLDDGKLNRVSLSLCLDLRDTAAHEVFSDNAHCELGVIFVFANEDAFILLTNGDMIHFHRLFVGNDSGADGVEHLGGSLFHMYQGEKTHNAHPDESVNNKFAFFKIKFM